MVELTFELPGQALIFDLAHQHFDQFRQTRRIGRTVFPPPVEVIRHD